MWAGSSSAQLSAQALVTHDSALARVVTHVLDLCVDQAIDRIDFLKVDIRGHEPQDLAGAAHVLSAARVGTLCCELNGAQEAGAACPASESIRLLE
jgi:hypothetical protein